MIETQVIKDYAYSLGFEIVRVTSAEELPRAREVIQERIQKGFMDGLDWFTEERAEVSSVPTALLPDAQSIISLGMVYLTEQPEEPATDALPHGRVARYAWGDDYHDVIKAKLRSFSEWLTVYTEREGGPDLATRLFVDTGRIVDRAVAERAGLGWYGKNTNILTQGWGSWLFLAEVVTNIPLVHDEALKKSCGSCEICLHACPTKALPQAYELDNRRCISFLTIELRGSIPLELRPLMGNLIFGCDICQEVCPVNKLAEKRLGLRPTQKEQLIPLTTVQKQQSPHKGHTEFQKRPQVGSTPDLINLLSLTEEEFRVRFRKSPIKRTKRRGLLRNVCVALGNSNDPRAIPPLIHALQDDEPLIRGHAAWALGRLGTTTSLNALSTLLPLESDPSVQQEILHSLDYMGALPPPTRQGS